MDHPGCGLGLASEPGERLRLVLVDAVQGFDGSGCLGISDVPSFHAC